MDLIEDYLKAVAALLPRGQREDIVAELRDIILTRKEEREAMLGRTLKPDEIEALLREIGHPLVVAARYGEGPQHVVGPMLYPYWLFGVKVVLAIETAVATVAFVVGCLAYGDVGLAFGRALAMAVTGAATLIGFATVAAWLIERKGIRIDYLDNWHVKDLRAFTAFEGWDVFQAGGDARGRGAERPDPRPPPRPATGRVSPRPWPAARGVGLIAWSAVLLLWWAGGLHILGPRGFADLREAFDPGALAAADWSALKAELFWPVLAYVLALMAQGVVLAAWPRLIRLHGLLDVLLGAALLVLVIWLWNAPVLATSVQVDSVAGFVVRLVQGFAHGPPFLLPAIFTAGLVFTGFGAICRMIQGLFEALLPGGWRAPGRSADRRPASRPI
ncbi:MAG: HAAS signaling domain-containing protein [Caulobacteraceae bacterium]